MSEVQAAEIYKVLLVDDSESTLRLVKIMIEDLGHQATAVSTPAEAIAESKLQPFHILITDLQMPGMSGLELANHLRAQGFDGPIIALTAHLSVLERENLLTQGLNDALVKPITREDLQTILASWLEDGRAIPQPKPTTMPQRYDDTLALERANGNPELAAELLQVLMETLKEDGETLGRSAKYFNHELFRRTLHKMLGGTRFSGATKLDHALQQLEVLTRAERRYDPAFHKSALDQINDEIYDLMVWYDRYHEEI